jgi:hypothetical protein
MALALVGVPAPTLGDAEEPQITLNLHGTFYAGSCGTEIIRDEVLPCDALQPWSPDTGGFAPVWAWIVVGGVEDRDEETGRGGIGGIQFGVEYNPGIAVQGWTLCTGGAEIPEDGPGGAWPASGTGNALTWNEGCYEVTENDDGVTAIGFLSLDAASTGLLRITADPRIGEAHMVDCGIFTHMICPDLFGTFDSATEGDKGQNPCGETCKSSPVRAVTWGSIKDLYGDAAAQ